MNKLDAVNEMLEAIGIPPVTALDTGGTNEESEAENILDRYTRRVQARGWAYNTADEVTLAVASDEINASSILSFTGGKDGKQYAIRGGKLYDPSTDTQTFTSSVVLLNVVSEHSFTEIPEHVADVIVAKAALAFARFKKQDLGEDRRYAARVAEAMQEANRIDGGIANVNILETHEANTNRGFPHGQR